VPQELDALAMHGAARRPERRHGEYSPGVFPGPLLSWAKAKAARTEKTKTIQHLRFIVRSLVFVMIEQRKDRSWDLFDNLSIGITNKLFRGF
jgi:hypothetical protein